MNLGGLSTKLLWLVAHAFLQIHVNNRACVFTSCTRCACTWNAASVLSHQNLVVWFSFFYPEAIHSLRIRHYLRVEWECLRDQPSFSQMLGVEATAVQTVMRLHFPLIRHMYEYYSVIGGSSGGAHAEFSMDVEEWQLFLMESAIVEDNPDRYSTHHIPMHRNLALKSAKELHASLHRLTIMWCSPSLRLVQACINLLDMDVVHP